jgi:hypothetical protein
MLRHLRLNAQSDQQKMKNLEDNIDRAMSTLSTCVLLQLKATSTSIQGNIEEIMRLAKEDGSADVLKDVLQRLKNPGTANFRVDVLEGYMRELLEQARKGTPVDVSDLQVRARTCSVESGIRARGTS